MYYVIQENIYKEYHFHTLMEYLKRYNLEHELVPWRPFDTKPISVKTDRKDVWFFGSIDTGIEFQQKQGWYPGIMYNDNHSFRVFNEKYGENMLNSDAVIWDLGQTFDEQDDRTFFIRPSNDTKAFTAKVYTAQEWNKYIQELKDSGLLEPLSKKVGGVVIATPKDYIQQEIRCWIIDGEPVTISQYKIGRRVNMLNMDNNEEAYIFSKKMAKIFCPSRVFVLDICLYQDDYKIVEINCANMSGFYDINISKLIQSLENTFNNGNRSN